MDSMSGPKRRRWIALTLPSVLVLAAAIGLHRWVYPSSPSRRATAPTAAHPELQSSQGPKAVDYRTILKTGWDPPGSHMRPVLDVVALDRLCREDAIAALESVLVDYLAERDGYPTDGELDLAASASETLVDRFGATGRSVLLRSLEKTAKKPVCHVIVHVLLLTRPAKNEDPRVILSKLSHGPSDRSLAWIDYILSEATGHARAIPDDALAIDNSVPRGRFWEHWERVLESPNGVPTPSPLTVSQGISQAAYSGPAPAYHLYLKYVSGLSRSYHVVALDKEYLRRLPPPQAVGVLYHILTDFFDSPEAGGQHELGMAQDACETALQWYGDQGRECLIEAYKAMSGRLVRKVLAGILLFHEMANAETIQVVMDGCRDESNPHVIGHLDFLFANLTKQPRLFSTFITNYEPYMTQDMNDYWKPKIAAFLKARE